MQYTKRPVNKYDHVLVFSDEEYRLFLELMLAISGVWLKEPARNFYYELKKVTLNND